MANIVNLDAESNADIVGDDGQPTLSLGNTGGGASLRVIATGLANATVAGLQLSDSSVASLAVMKLDGTAFVSAVSIVYATSANWAGQGAMRIVKTDGTFGWIPVLPDAVVSAAVVK